MSDLPPSRRDERAEREGREVVFGEHRYRLDGDRIVRYRADNNFWEAEMHAEKVRALAALLPGSVAVAWMVYEPDGCRHEVYLSELDATADATWLSTSNRAAYRVVPLTALEVKPCSPRA